MCFRQGRCKLGPPVCNSITKAAQQQQQPLIEAVDNLHLQIRLLLLLLVLPVLLDHRSKVREEKENREERRSICIENPFTESHWTIWCDKARDRRRHHNLISTIILIIIISDRLIGNEIRLATITVAREKQQQHCRARSHETESAARYYHLSLVNDSPERQQTETETDTVSE